MKLLLDQNLTHMLCDNLNDIFPKLTHVKNLSLQSAIDVEIWEYSKNNSFTIVTKDSDFNDRSIIEGFPPKVIWIKKGNCSTTTISLLLRNNYIKISNFILDDENSILILE